MNVLVLGRAGLVGTHLVDELLNGRSVIAGLDLEDGGNVTNLDGLSQAVRSLMASHSWKSIDWVVNLAAMTAVDACESQKELAHAANADGARHAAIIAKEIEPLLQISTDYVFDGKKRAPYTEEDAANPLSEYGRTKLLGEVAARSVLPEDRLLIVRGQSLYGRALKSFPDAIVRMANEGKPVRIVKDQVVAPTWADDFAAGLVALMTKREHGLFHLSAAGSCTWFEFAQFVFTEWGLDPGTLVPITATELGRPAKRPEWSVFDLGKFTTTTGVVARDWRAQFKAYRTSQGDYQPLKDGRR